MVAELDSNGSLFGRTGNTVQPLTWNGAYGYEYIPFTGLYHIGAQEYDPKTRRWLQRDPIDVAGGHPNVYLYCAGNPIGFVDPEGTRALTERDKQLLHLLYRYRGSVPLSVINRAVAEIKAYISLLSEGQPDSPNLQASW